MQTFFAKNKDVTLAYETVGELTGEPLLFISGLGSQLVYWSDELCEPFLERGFFIIRFDNRDVGLSTKIDVAKSGAYSLADMAADAVAVLDAVGIEKANVVGNSLGGMIAQTMAIEHPQRVKTLTSIMSAPSADSIINGDAQQQGAMAASVTVDVSDPETFVDLQVEGYRVTSGPHFDEAYMRGIVQRSFERGHYAAGWANQLGTAVFSPDRTEKLKQLDLPSLVIHGALDPLIPVAAGRATAAAIPNAKLLIFDDMGHNLPRHRWGEIAEAVAQLVKESEK